MSAIVLGLDVNDYNTSAAVVIDGEVASAAHEERFSRQKRTRAFPLSAMRWAMRRAGVIPADFDAVAVSVNPAIYLESLNSAQSGQARCRGELLYGPANWLLGTMPGADARHTRLIIDEEVSGGLDIHYVTHHDAHAAAAFYTSPFDSAAVLSVDGFGEKETTVLYSAEGERISRLGSVEFPHSIGCFYAAMTEFLGMSPNRHEWKLMGAASHGDATRFLKEMQSLIRYTSGGFEINLPYFNFYHFHRPGWFSPRMAELFGEPYRSPDDADERFFDIAAATQKVTEDLVFRLLEHLAEIAPCGGRLCLTGGVAMNCSMNGKVAANTPFENVFVPSAPDDSGTSIGAALHVYHSFFHSGRRPSQAHNYFGPAFSDAQIEAELERAKVRFEKPAEIAAAAARCIADGMIVGWFQGAMEFGDRALGNRSILADPRSADAPDRISTAIKDRAAWQPYAPSVLAERAEEFFLDVAPSPFMDKTFYALPEARARIPAVLAADGSARVQTVTPEQNPLFHRLIGEFAAITDVPMVLNTSFNLRGEPIVCTPRDALRTFYSSGLDALFIGGLMVKKH